MTHTVLCLRDYVPENNIFELKQTGKTEVLREITDRAKVLSILPDDPASSEVFHQLLKREQLGSTGIVNGIAIPHCKTDLIEPEMSIFIGYSSAGIEFNAYQNVFKEYLEESSTPIGIKPIKSFNSKDARHDYIINLVKSGGLFFLEGM